MPPPNLRLVRRSRQVARARTRGSSRASRSARRCARTRLLSTSDCERVEVGVADRLGRLERAAAARRRRAARRAAAPRRRAARSSTRSSRAASAGAASASRPPLSRSSRCAEALEDLRGREHARARGGELERERQVVEAPAELRDRSSARARSTPRARAEELDRLVAAERRHRVLDARRGQRSSSRLVTSSCRFGHAPSSAAELGAPRRPPARSCRAGAAARVSPTCSASPSFAPSACAIVSSTSAGSRSGGERHPEDAVREASGTQLGGRLEREPRLARCRPGPVSVTRRTPLARAALDHLGELPLAADERRRRHAAGSCSVERLQRRERRRRRAGRSAPARRESFSRCSPRSRSAVARRRAARVAAESSTCPPWPAAAIRAARCTSVPDVAFVGRRAASRCGCPSARGSAPPRAPPCASRAAATAPGAVGNATKNASPCVSTSTPSWRANASRTTCRCSASASRVALARRARAAAASSPRCR